MWQINYSVASLVSSHRGTLPVLLSCPHGGSETVPDVPPRTGRGFPAECHFSDDADLHTRDITRGVAQRLLDTCGEAPYVAIADYHRKFIDANREAACAYEHPNAQPFYDQYHGTLRTFVDEIRAESGGLGLLFDIHGTAGIEDDPADLYFGTDNGEAVKRLLQVDPQALWRRRSLRGFLHAAGYTVSPKAPGVPENPKLDGGFTVRSYGSSKASGLDAMQIEIAAPLRKDTQKRDALIEHLAAAIGSLVACYADVHTLAAFGSINVLDSNAMQTLTATLQQRITSKDARLRLGGINGNRGRLEIRHDALTPKRAGVLVLYDESGNDHYLWVDRQGRLRISASDPRDDSLSGAIVGSQT
jgi:N-formylglutamate amidohydrolase